MEKKVKTILISGTNYGKDIRLTLQNRMTRRNKKVRNEVVRLFWNYGYLLNSIRVKGLESISIMKWNYFTLWHRRINFIICRFYLISYKVVKILFRFPDIHYMIISRITKPNSVKYFSFGFSMFPVNLFFNFLLLLFGKSFARQYTQNCHTTFSIPWYFEFCYSEFHDL